ncbi:MAG: DNA methylase [Candidatus Omnitrophica bacterium]|nr:DNA methylase [Candidatus Omnitrophota bacterium]
MAESLAHSFGQIIGSVLEDAILPDLEKFAGTHGLYLDKKGPRKARKGRKVSWTDQFGNTHDLDFVLERGGDDETIGTPVAFIETAWRRYTKHSRNKAQEIQGAIQLLSSTHKHSCPFTGIILAGVFTEGALTQLRTLGFQVLHFSYESIINAFKSVGVDAAFDEGTEEAEFRRKIEKWDSLDPRSKARVRWHLLRSNKAQLQRFLRQLERSITRRVDRVVILPLYGHESEHASVAAAIQHLRAFTPNSDKAPLRWFEIRVKYSNGDHIDGQFETKESAIEFLEKFT